MAACFFWCKVRITESHRFRGSGSRRRPIARAHAHSAADGSDDIEVLVYEVALILAIDLCKDYRREGCAYANGKRNREFKCRVHFYSVP